VANIGITPIGREIEPKENLPDATLEEAALVNKLISCFQNKLMMHGHRIFHPPVIVKDADQI